MPQCCVVPLCSSRTSGHRFPNDNYLTKKWIIAIRRYKYTPTSNARICNKHFVSTDYVMPLDSMLKCPKPRLKKDAIPSQFSWTKEEKVLAKQREERVAKRAQKKQSLNSSSTSDVSKPNAPEPCNEIEIPMTLTEAEEDKQQKVMKCDSSTMTSTPLNLFCIENLQAESKVDELKFYTGFDSFEHFWLVFNILGPAVNHLFYYPSGCLMSVHVLTPANEFLLTVVKLRRNMINKELAFKFDISEVCLCLLDSITTEPIWLKFGMKIA